MGVPYVINIQKYSIHDGDGIRTTVFFKGCLLNCWWCHNPESQKYNQELMFHFERCGGCHSCENICPEKAIEVKENKAYTNRDECVLCSTCLDYCTNNVREIVGKHYTIKELMKEIEKDRMFFEQSKGGVTLSGGEVMTQDMDYMTQLLKELKRKGYDVCIDTCGYAPQKNYEKVLPYVNTFLYDIKIMNNELHKKYMGKDNELIFSNLKYISDNGANIYIRIPVIGSVNDTEENMEEIVEFLKDNINVKQINLLPYHNTGSNKYEKLEEEYLGKEFYTPTKENMKKFKEIFIKSGFNNVKIGG